MLNFRRRVAYRFLWRTSGKEEFKDISNLVYQAFKILESLNPSVRNPNPQNAMFAIRSERALTLMQDAVDILSARDKGESLADVSGQAAQVQNNLVRLMTVLAGASQKAERSSDVYVTQEMLRSLESLTKNVKEQAVTLLKLSRGHRMAAGGARLDAPTKKRVNDQISRLIKNRYFEKAQQALAGVLEVLSNFDIELNDIVNSFVFTQPDGRVTQDLAFSNAEQPMAPVPIRNAMLVFMFHQMESGRFEITAYVS